MHISADDGYFCCSTCLSCWGIHSEVNFFAIGFHTYYRHNLFRHIHLQFYCLISTMLKCMYLVGWHFLAEFVSPKELQKPLECMYF